MELGSGCAGGERQRRPDDEELDQAALDLATGQDLGMFLQGVSQPQPQEFWKGTLPDEQVYRMVMHCCGVPM